MTTIGEVITYMWFPLWTAMFGAVEEILSWFFVDMVFLGYGIGWYMLIIGLFYYVLDFIYSGVNPLGFAQDIQENYDRRVARNQRARDNRANYNTQHSQANRMNRSRTAKRGRMYDKAYTMNYHYNIKHKLIDRSDRLAHSSIQHQSYTNKRNIISRSQKRGV